ncbi:MAG: TetR/AcrR family transcriptional regulator [Desulfomonilaceae bacterium]|nr:TetR/AcrR family transcriptional regulator [Desulfomonilaceae bacterium]
MAQTQKHGPPASTRNAILDAAEKIFIERGFSDTSMSKIAKAARVTKSLIHHHFGSKEQLWAEIKKRRFHEYFSVQKEQLAAADAGIESFKTCIINLFNVLRDDPEVVRLISWHLLDRAQTERHEDEKELTAMGHAKLLEGQELGYLRNDIDTRYMLISFFCLVFHWFMSKHEYLKWVGIEPDSITADDEYLENMLKIFFQGVLPR